MEFDAVSCCVPPTGFLGVPRVSNAFAIAGRLGLAEEILERGKPFFPGGDAPGGAGGESGCRPQKDGTASRQAEEERKQTQELLRTLRREKEDLEREKAAILEKAKRRRWKSVSRAAGNPPAASGIAKWRHKRKKPAAARIEKNWLEKWSLLRKKRKHSPRLLRR